jgi:hypothetical protein
MTDRAPVIIQISLRRYVKVKNVAAHLSSIVYQTAQSSTSGCGQCAERVMLLGRPAVNGAVLILILFLIVIVVKSGLRLRGRLGLGHCPVNVRLDAF